MTTDPTDDPRAQLLHALDFSACQGLGYSTPEELLAAYDTIRIPPPTDRTALRDCIAEALDNAHRTHPCPVTGDQIWSGCVHYDDAGRVVGVGSCHSERRADAVLAVLPPPADQAAVLREAADQYAKLADQNEAYDREQGQLDETARLQHETVRDVVTGLRRMADETATDQPAPDSATLLELVRDFLDPDPCSFDHHGYCQAHAAGFGGEPLSCPHGRARKLLAALEQSAAETQRESCAHCGKNIRRITGTLAAWWVHDLGGNTVCHPEQAASSPRATPKTDAIPVEHAPGKAIRCPDCRAKGYAVCRNEPAAGARQDATATDEPAPGSTEPRPCRTFVSGGTVWCCEEGETDCPCVCHQPAAGARISHPPA